MIWNERIKALRKERDLTLKDVARLLGVTEATAQRYESNAIKAIPYETISKLAEIFDCSPSYIMGWENGETLTLNDAETELIKAYRKAPEGRRDAVRALLGL